MNKTTIQYLIIFIHIFVHCDIGGKEWDDDLMLDSYQFSLGVIFTHLACVQICLIASCRPCCLSAKAPV